VNAEELEGPFGFVEGGIAYSQDPFFIGDTIQIHTFIFNSSSEKLSGTIEFFDSNTLIGEREFSIEKGGALPISIDWTVTPGTHEIFASMRAEHTPEDSGETITLSNRPKTSISEKTAKHKIELNNEDIQSLVEEYIPESVSSITANIDSWREEQLEKFTQKGEEEKERIEANKLSPATDEFDIENAISNASEDAEGIKIKSDIGSKFKSVNFLAGTKSVFYSILAFIFSSSLIFYIVLISLVILVIGILWRSLFRR